MIAAALEIMVQNNLIWCQTCSCGDDPQWAIRPYNQLRHVQQQHTLNKLSRII